MTDQPLFELPELLSILPHRPPFLFVDRVMKLEPHKLIIAERTLRPDEPQFAGHFPGRAIMPGVLVTEALAQTSGLLLGLSERATGAAPPESPKMFFLAANAMKYQHPAAPGDVLVLRAGCDKNFGGLFRFNVEATAGRNLVASGSLTLALVSGKRS
jgi:3-hydroxymyristoyl/3-hydroxydecanoyl-(acyl carrier protein) dehydratase